MPARRLSMRKIREVLRLKFGLGLRDRAIARSCSIPRSSVANYVLRPELADKFSVPIGSTINSASGVNILLVLGWGFNYFGQLLSRQARTVDTEVDKVPQIAAAD